MAASVEVTHRRAVEKVAAARLAYNLTVLVAKQTADAYERGQKLELLEEATPGQASPTGSDRRNSLGSEDDGVEAKEMQCWLQARAWFVMIVKERADEMCDQDALMPVQFGRGNECKVRAAARRGVRASWRADRFAVCKHFDGV